MKQRIKNRKKDKRQNIYCGFCLESIESPKYECKCNPDALYEKELIQNRDKFNRNEWPKLYRDITTTEYALCTECGNSIDLNQPILYCSTDQSNTYECMYRSVYNKLDPLCKNCINECGDCMTRYCNQCWAISIKKKDEYPCISHRHCKTCAKKPSICNVPPMSACGCGCGDYAPHELIWKNIQAKTEYTKYYNKR
jgi:hypothetical protein